jgi:hypothetical protein
MSHFEDPAPLVQFPAMLCEANLSAAILRESE